LASAAGLGGQLGGRLGGQDARPCGRLARVSVQERGLLWLLAAVEAVSPPLLQNQEIFFGGARLKDAKNVYHLL
jgi:hypothetical protein